MTTENNWFDGLGSASPDGKSAWVNPGTYLVQVENIIRKMSQNEKGRLFIIEFTILEVLAAHEGDGNFQPSNQKGERCSQVIMLDKTKSSPLSKVKNFLLPFTGMDQGDGDDSEWAQLAMDISDPAQDWAERSLGMNTQVVLVAGKTFTNAGNPFTTMQWLAVPEDGDTVV